jgi:transketolase
MKNTQTKIMRDVLIEEIYNRMFHDENIFFVSADFGSPVLDKLKGEFKERFINVGIAEQNLINLSAGLALEGFTVYAYAIAPFLTMRAYEQLRVNLSLTSQLKEINVNLIGVGAGVSYDVSGPTHHCFEDISIMRTLPNFMVFSPSDWKLTESFVDLSINIKKPKYIRLDGKPLPQIYSNIKRFDLEKGFCELSKGEKICLVSTGYMTHKALKIAKELKKEIGIIDVFRLKPIDETLLFDALKKYEWVITIEEGFINKGGLDSLVLNILKNRNPPGIGMKNFGFRDKYVFEMGSRDYLYKLHGFDEKSIIEVIKECEKA